MLMHAKRSFISIRKFFHHILCERDAHKLLKRTQKSTRTDSWVHRVELFFKGPEKLPQKYLEHFTPLTSSKPLVNTENKRTKENKFCGGETGRRERFLHLRDWHNEFRDFILRKLFVMFCFLYQNIPQ